MTDDTVPVWVKQDGIGGFYLNWHADMRERFDDWIDRGNAGWEWRGLHYSASRLLKTTDPVQYEQEFIRFQTYFVEMDMPADLAVNGSAPEQREWVRVNFDQH